MKAASSALDRDNLAEEIESLGREQFNKLVSALRVAMMHMVKWDHQPRQTIAELGADRSKSSAWKSLTWSPTIPASSRASAKPSMRAYRRAQIEAAKETGLDDTTFPADCPYSFDDIMLRMLAR